MVYLLFFLSGAAALVGEVSWSRQVGLVLGNTAWSAALVLATFFTGMGLGQFAGGRLVSRVCPLFGYGLAELAAATWTAFVPSLLDRVGVLAFSDASLTAMCFVILLPTTIPFGATLPFVAEHLASSDTTPRKVTLAYGLNTAGGLLGVAVTLFMLCEVGVRSSSYVAAGVSAACGLLACILARRGGSAHSSELPATGEQTEFTWFLLAAVSGVGTLGLEVLYTRLFALVLHNSTYTFGAVVAVFLAGLALGAVLVTAISCRISARRLASIGCSLGAVATAGSVVVFLRLTGFDYFSSGDSFAPYIGGVMLLGTAVVLPPVGMLGATLPAVFAANTWRSGRVIGKLAAVNTAGAVAGALAAGFVFLPWLGLWGTFALHIAIFGVVGFGLLWRDGIRMIATTAGLAATIGAVVVVSAPRQVAVSGGEEELVRRWETAAGWIDVTRVRKTGDLRVRQNLHYRHGSTASAVREFRQGRLPLLLHPHPKEVAFLGLGTGLTAAPAVADSAVERVTVVELIPEVVEAARFLGDANLGVVDHAKVEMLVADGRQFLNRTGRTFDIIVADLFVPWESRAGYLYTVEFHEAARKRLKPGGVFCQWLALYQFGPQEFELVADSFAAVFPEITLWWGQLDGRFPIVALVGSEMPLDLDPHRVESFPDVAGKRDPELSRPTHLAGLYAGQWVARPHRRLNTDEHPWLEFSAPISHRSRRSLSGPALEAYFDLVLAKLPAGNVRLAHLQGTEPVKHREMQRLSLFGASVP